MFLKRKEEGKLKECSKRLRYGYLSKYGYGFTYLLVRNPPNSFFDCVWIGKTIIHYTYVCVRVQAAFFSLIRIGFEEFLYKGNVGVLGEMLSHFFQNPCFCFGHNLTIAHPN